MADSLLRVPPSGQPLRGPLTSLGSVLAVWFPNGIVEPIPIAQVLALANTYSPLDVGTVLGVGPDGSVVPMTTSAIDVPMTNVRYADAETAVIPTDQNGSQALPFASIGNSFIDLLPVGGVIYATPEDYTAEGTIAISANASVLSLGQPGLQSASVNEFNIHAGVFFGMSNLDVQVLNMGAGSAAIAIASELTAVTGVGDLSLYQNCETIGAVACTTLYAQQSTINGDVSLLGTSCTFDDCAFGALIVISFAAPGGVLKLNGTSYRAFLGAGGSVVNGSIQSDDFLPPVADSTVLATPALAHVPNGQGVYVLSRGRIYWSVPVGAGDVVGTGNDWKSDSSTSSPLWRSQSTWFLSNVGSDDASGVDSAHPLSSVAELQARWGTNVILAVSQNITFLTDHAGGTLEWSPIDWTITVDIEGLPTVLNSYTLATYAAQNAGANIWARLTLTGLADFTSYVNEHLRVTSGAQIGAGTHIALANPQGSGVATAETNLFSAKPTFANNWSTSVVTPASGDSIDIVHLPVIDHLIFRINGLSSAQDVAGTGTQHPSYFIANCTLTNFGVSLNSQALNGHRIWGCTMKNWAPEGSSQLNASVNATLMLALQSRLAPAAYAACTWKSGAASVSTLFSYVDCNLTNALLEGLKLTILQGSIQINSGGFFNCSGNALTINAGNAVVLSTNLLGQGNSGFGVSLSQSAQLILSATPTVKLTGTSGDWQSIGSPAFTWNQTPRQFNSGAVGPLTLTDGVVAATIPNLPVDAVVGPVYLLPAAGALSLGIDSQGTGGFNFKSLNLTDSTSTVRATWYSPGSGPGGVFVG